MLTVDSDAALDAWLEDHLDAHIHTELSLAPSPSSTLWGGPLAAGFKVSVLPARVLSPGPFPWCSLDLDGAAVDPVACSEAGMLPPSCEPHVPVLSDWAPSMLHAAGQAGSTSPPHLPMQPAGLAFVQDICQPSMQQDTAVDLSPAPWSNQATAAAAAGSQQQQVLVQHPRQLRGREVTTPATATQSRSLASDSSGNTRTGGGQQGGRRKGRGRQAPTTSARYHAARRAGMAALEAEVASKAAQVAALEAQRGALAQRTHVLETMVADADKLLQLLAASKPEGRAGPHTQAEEVVVLLTSGTPRSCAVPRPLHLMLERGTALNPLAWPLQEVLQRWGGYVVALRPLLGVVAQVRAALPPPADEAQEGTLRRGPRRAAAAAANRIASMAQQLGESGAHTDEDDDVEASVSLATPQLRQGGRSSGACSTLSCCWPPAGEVDGRVVYGGPGTEGVPLELLAQVEHLVLDNMAWLHVLATSTALHKHHFFAADFEGHERLPPPPCDPFWQRVVAAMQPTPDQRSECAASLEAAQRCRAVMCTDRQHMQEQLTATAAACSPTCCDALARCTALEAAAAAAAGMERSLAREHITRHLVGMAQSNVFSLLQQAQAAVAAWPWFPGSWSVFQAAAAGLQEGPSHQLVV